jgi:hypothetical protein
MRRARAQLKDNLAVARALRREIDLTLLSQRREADETVRKSRALIEESMRLLRELRKQGI